MDAFSTIVKFFQDCGLFIYPSALIMALGVTIAIERFIFLSKARKENRKVWAQVLPMLQKGQFRVQFGGQGLCQVGPLGAVGQGLGVGVFERRPEPVLYGFRQVRLVDDLE